MCATVTLGWTNYAGYRVTLLEQSAARSERVFLAGVAIALFFTCSAVGFCVSAIRSILSLNFMVHALSSDSPLSRRPALQRLRDAYRWHLVVSILVIVLCSTVMVAVAIAS